jgi:DNA-binding transcriptional MocR family regulator
MIIYGRITGRVPSILTLAHEYGVSNRTSQRAPTTLGRRHQVNTPAPAGRQSPPQRHPMTATARTNRAVLLAPGILSPSKDHRQGRSLRSRLRWRYAPPWTVIFVGKTRHLSGGREQFGRPSCG